MKTAIYAMLDDSSKSYTFRSLKSWENFVKKNEGKIAYIQLAPAFGKVEIYRRGNNGLFKRASC